MGAWLGKKDSANQQSKMKLVPKYIPQETYCEACRRVSTYLYDAKMRFLNKTEEWNVNRSLKQVCNHVENFRDTTHGHKDSHLWQSCKLHTENYKLRVIREIQDNSENYGELTRWLCHDVAGSCVGVNATGSAKGFYKKEAHEEL